MLTVEFGDENGVTKLAPAAPSEGDASAANPTEPAKEATAPADPATGVKSSGRKDVMQLRRGERERGAASTKSVQAKSPQQ